MNNRLTRRLILAASAAAALTSMLPMMASAIDRPRIAPPSHWRELQQPSYLAGSDGGLYYSFTTKNGSRAHLVIVNYKSGKWQIKPYLNEPTATTSESAEKMKASACINGGYFNLSDGVSASYITIDGKEVANPRTNDALIKNPKLANSLEAIFNRSEIRFLEDKKRQPIIDIAVHNAPLPEGTKLVHALQAGPQLLPKATEKEEAFIRTEPDGKEADSISSKSANARSAFGITDDGNALLVTVCGSGQDESSPGVTTKALAELMAGLGCSKAINLDGGTSTTLFVRKQSEGTDIATGKVVCGKTPETKVKSVLLVLPVTTK